MDLMPPMKPWIRDTPEFHSNRPRFPRAPTILPGSVRTNATALFTPLAITWLATFQALAMNWLAAAKPALMKLTTSLIFIVTVLTMSFQRLDKNDRTLSPNWKTASSTEPHASRHQLLNAVIWLPSQVIAFMIPVIVLMTPNADTTVAPSRNIRS